MFDASESNRAGEEMNQAIADHNRAVARFGEEFAQLIPAAASQSYPDHCRWMVGRSRGTLETRTPEDLPASMWQVLDQHKLSMDRFGKAALPIALSAASFYLMRKYQGAQEVQWSTSNFPAYAPTDTAEIPDDPLPTQYDFAQDVVLDLLERLCHHTILPTQEPTDRVRWIRSLVKRDIIGAFRESVQPYPDPLLGDLWLDFAALVKQSEALAGPWLTTLAVIEDAFLTFGPWNRFERAAHRWGDQAAFDDWQALRRKHFRQFSDPGNLRWLWRALSQAIRKSQATYDSWNDWERAVRRASGGGDRAAQAWLELTQKLRGGEWPAELNRPMYDLKTESDFETEFGDLKPSPKPSPGQIAERRGSIRAYLAGRDLAEEATLDTYGKALLYIRPRYILLRVCSGAGRGEIAKELLLLDQAGAGLRDSSPARATPFNPIVSRDLKRLRAALHDTADDGPVGERLEAAVHVGAPAWRSICRTLHECPPKARTAGRLFARLFDLATGDAAAERHALREQGRGGRPVHLALEPRGDGSMCLVRLDVTWRAVVAQQVARNLGQEIILIHDILQL